MTEAEIQKTASAIRATVSADSSIPAITDADLLGQILRAIPYDELTREMVRRQLRNRMEGYPAGDGYEAVDPMSGPEAVEVLGEDMHDMAAELVEEFETAVEQVAQEPEFQ